MTSREIRKKFLDFFVQKNHLPIPSFSLVPENDPTLLLVNSGMAPMRSYFLGLEEPPAKRLVDIQKCVRMEDLEEVGSSPGKLTFFEMMGNWSIGDYGQKEALIWAWDLLIEGFGFDPLKLWATVFAGAGNLPPDNEVMEIWKKLGIPEERMIKLGMDDNFWVSGLTGPCGPCSEVFYDLGEEKGPAMKGDTYNRSRLFEIWNACVSIQYNRDDKGNYQNLPFCSIDAGAGVERFSMVLQKTDTVFETDLFQSIIQSIEVLFGESYQEEKNKKPIRIIADHLRAATFLIADGVSPSNVEQGYVLRRLIRRAIKVGRSLQLTEVLAPHVAKSVIQTMKTEYPLLETKSDLILSVMKDEEEKFKQALERGLKEIEKYQFLDGKTAFHLYESYGIPLEVSEEIATERGQKIDQKAFEEEFQKHQELSRAGAKAKFSGGLADHSEQVTKYHTATHLLQAALREVLGSHLQQKGSNITAERLRFDFSQPEKLNEEQIKKVEDLVNQKIQENLLVKMEMMTLAEAKKQGALAVFEQRYGEQVKVFSINDFSKEVCGGPHVNFTGELGRFKIIKEETAGAGLRRIYATLS